MTGGRRAPSARAGALSGPGRRGRLPNWAIGVALIAVLAVGSVLAFAGELPWSSGHELRAVLPKSQGMVSGSPVRVAGVEVGEVTDVEHLAAADDAASRAAGATVITMELDEAALPIRADATLRVRPRLFLEGNYFVDLRTGSPGAPEVPEGHVVPITSTAAPVQLDEVLTDLPAAAREDLQTALRELAGALEERGGARGLRQATRHSAGAFRHTAVVNEALLGREPHDLSGVVRNLQRVVAALGANEGQLAESVGALNLVSGALAAEGAALERAVARLPATIAAARPTLAALNRSLPAARAFAREALPGVRALSPALDATAPLLLEARGLLTRRELRGAAAALRRAAPPLALLVARTPQLLAQARALSSCFNEIVVPWANMTVPDPETPASGRIFEETSYGLVGISGESRSFDANGPYARVLGGSGANVVTLPPVGGGSDELVGVTSLPLLGARPSLESSAKPPLRRDVPCERNEPPDLDAGEPAAAPQQRSTGGPAGSSIELTEKMRSRLREIARRLDRADRAGASASDAGAAQAVRRMREGALGRLDRLLSDALGWAPGTGEGR